MKRKLQERGQDDPRTGYPTTRYHGHTIREGQPRVRLPKLRRP